MKKIRLFLPVAILSCAIATSCVKKVQTEEAVCEVSLPAYVYSGETPLLSPICAFLTDSLGAFYLQGDVCIPCPIVVKTDESDPADIRVWGDFWVFNYDLVGDTLKMASGGSHPGLFHLTDVDGKYVVSAFDRVGDGSSFEPTAKAIFGDSYDDLLEACSDTERGNAIRTSIISDYVKANQLSISCYQDFGWDAVPLDE